MPNAMSDRPALRWPIQLFRYCDVILNDDLMEFIRWHRPLVHFKPKHMSYLDHIRLSRETAFAA